MTNKSNIQPHTTHVHIEWDTYSATMVDWLKAHTSRVDVYAHLRDDPLDHYHMLAVIQGKVIMNTLTGSFALLESWADQVSLNEDRYPSMLFAFEDRDQAMLFKLTFGGAA